ncbi:hypothetical protein FRB95_012277 [Tulasnella sp. JGI-2019a]|nr:hypothetical protein FRB95_012277 [Tulasnella sp. JGI-2019a]
MAAQTTNLSVSIHDHDRVASPTSPLVMLWDPKTERFAQHATDPHSSSQSPLPPPRRSSSLSYNRPRERRLSVPDSIRSLDFGEFLRELDRAPPHSPTGTGCAPSRASTDVDEYHISEATASQGPLKQPSHDHVAAIPSWKPGKVLKTALKEVLGGGGNNKRMPKDPVVALPFGRGGVAIKSKAVTEKQVKPDPYLTHVPATSPPSGLHFPPNANIQVIIPRRKSIAHDRDHRHNTSPSYGSPPEMYGQSPSGRYYINHATHRPNGHGPAVYDRPECQPRRRNDPTTPSPSSSASHSTLTASEGHHSEGSRARSRPLEPSLAPPRQVNQRRRATSVDSFTSPVPAIPTGPGIHIHPQQMAMEAAEARRKEILKGEKECLRVVTCPSREKFAGNARGREVDVMSVADTDADNDDAMSLSSFPAPPSTYSPTSPIHRNPTRSWSLPTESSPTPTAYPTDINTKYGASRGIRVGSTQYRQQQPRTHLPTMPGPLVDSESNVRRADDNRLHHRDRRRNKIHHLPPVPPLPAPTLLPHTTHLPRLPTQAQGSHAQSTQHADGIHGGGVSAPGTSDSQPTLPAPVSVSVSSSGVRQALADQPSDEAMTTRARPASSDMTIAVTTTSFVDDDTPDSVFSLMYTGESSLQTGLQLLPQEHKSEKVNDEEELALQRQADALAREREMLEDRVRGLMWLVNSLEVVQQQQLTGQQGAAFPILQSAEMSPSSVAPIPRGAEGDTSVNKLYVVDDLERRSSTSTERAGSYLPYAR